MKREGRFRPLQRGIPLRAIAPNAVTVTALCFGLTGIRFAIDGKFEQAVIAILIAGVLDGMDGRIARALHGESRFGAELDSLADSIAFGVAPALVIFLWSLHDIPQYGWLFALAHAVFCVLRLARFNAQIDSAEQPHKSAGFLTGVPAPAGAGLAFLPMFLWLWTGIEDFRNPYFVAPWIGLVAFLMISSVATYSWSSMKLRQNVRFEAIAVIALVTGALITAPWATLSVVSAAYILTIPFSILSYRKVRRQRAAVRGPVLPAAHEPEQPAS